MHRVRDVWGTLKNLRARKGPDRTADLVDCFGHDQNNRAVSPERVEMQCGRRTSLTTTTLLCGRRGSSEQDRFENGIRESHSSIISSCTSDEKTLAGLALE